MKKRKVLIILVLLLTVGYASISTSLMLGGKVGIASNVYKEEILNGTDPALGEGLIPVIIADDGTVLYADIGTEWYKYADKRWANAVILEEGKSYNVGDEIPEEAIESYFVWIPRYRYKIWNTGNYPNLTSVANAVQTIDIVFENKDTPVSNGSTKDSWLTHPAFTAFGTNGLWIGKFETGYKEATSPADSESNTYNLSKVIIKPSVYSWRGIQVVNAHKNSFNYKRDLDSHMMKNTEWGAVAYLQHSIYGSRKSVRINNNINYVTGYSAKNEPTCGYSRDNRDCNKYESTSLGEDGTNTYNYLSNQKDSAGNIISDLASTTGNKSGVYDMSGGAWEYVMGVMLYNDNKTPCAGRSSGSISGFAGPHCNGNGTAAGENFPEAKYYDTYAYGTNDVTYTRRILGDATGEIGPFVNVNYGIESAQISSWYLDYARFIWTEYPWFIRGGSNVNGSDSGVFSFGSFYGLGITSIGFSHCSSNIENIKTFR